MVWVAGVDGCRAGWVVVLVEKRPAGVQSPLIRVCKRFDEVLALSPEPLVIAIDIPIGLLEAPQRGGRDCDRQARQLLGPRQSSVFSPPARNQLNATTGLSQQTLGILPKIVEVDRLMTTALQNTVHESHPELAFRSLTGQPMKFNKKSITGRAARLKSLGSLFPGINRYLAKCVKDFPRRAVAPDDLLDASALAWTALRIAEKKAQRVPAHPQVDSKGLRMEIWY